MTLWFHLEQWCHSFIHLWKTHHLFVDVRSHNSQLTQQHAGLCWIYSPPTFIFLKFSRALSICGVSIQPVSVREPLLLSALLCSVILSTSGGLLSLNLCGSTLDPSPPVCLSCYKKQSCLTFSFSCPGWGETHSVCSRGQAATRWLLWLVCINKKRQIISTNSFIKVTGHKTERD